MKHKKIISLILVFSMIIVSFIAFNKDTIISKAASAQLDIELSIANNWESGSDTFIQVDATITNNGTATAKGWTASIPVDENTDVDNSWNITYTLENSIVTVSPIEHNSTIASGSSITFGLVFKNAANFDASLASITTAGNTSTSTAIPVPSSTVSSEVTESSSSTSETTTYIPTPTSEVIVTEKTSDDWLYTDGSKILDKDGKEVWLTGINWFGYNTGTNTFDGIWSCDLNTALKSIADRGFNLLRVPFSSELILEWKNGSYPKACYNDYVNDYLAGMNSLEIWDYVVEQCRANGIKIMIDIHSAETNAAGHFAPLWYTENITEEQYLESLSWMADRYKDDDTIIAYDLKNEPHGAVGDKQKAIWNDSTSSNNWKYAAEKAAFAVLNENPNALVMVEGIQIYPTDITTNSDFSSTNKNDYYNTWWGGNLRGVADYPVELGKFQNKLVYSPHDYGPAVSDQPWFSGNYTMESLYNNCWKDNWFFIQEQNIAPLLVGEWGGFMTEPNLTWMTYFRQFIIDNKINHTFWCFNANSGDTGGLVQYDFTTWDEEKYEFVKEALWQKDGKFVGLDHQIPLGSNGITLSAY